LVVRFAPQLDIVKRAAAVITHAGLNTVLESLNEGVPLVCLPLGNDQPGVAARVKARGAGVSISRARLTVPRLRAAVGAVLEEPKYRMAAQQIQKAMHTVDGLERAADVIERTLRLQAAPSLLELEPSRPVLGVPNPAVIIQQLNIAEGATGAFAGR
jgi:MGT family glycosyltransferase